MFELSYYVNLRKPLWQSLFSRIHWRCKHSAAASYYVNQTFGRLAVARREPTYTPEQAFGKKPAKPHGSKAPEEIPKPLQLQAFATDPSPAPNKCLVYIIILPMFHVEHRTSVFPKPNRFT